MDKDLKKNNRRKSYSSSSKKIATLSFLTALQVPSCVNSKSQRFIPSNQTCDSTPLIPDNVIPLQQKAIDTLLKICPDLNGQNALRDAIKKGDLKEVNDLLKGSSDPNKVGNHLTSLVLALKCKCKKIVHALLANKHIDTTTPDPETGLTPLHLAVINKWKHATTWLIEKLPVEASYVQDKNGKTPLYYAIASNDINIVELLIKRELPAKEVLVELLMSTLKYEDTISFRYKYEKMVHFLLTTLLSKYNTPSLDYLCDLTDESKRTLLHLLVKRGDIYALKMLVKELSLKVLFAQDNKQKTALQMASGYKSKKITTILLDRINKLDKVRAVEALFTTDYKGYTVIESSYLPKHKDLAALLHNSHIQLPTLSRKGSEMFKYILLKLLPSLNMHLDVNQLIIISRSIEDKVDGMTMHKGYAAKLRPIVSAYIMQEYGANAKQILKKVSHEKNLLQWQVGQDNALAG